MNLKEYARLRGTNIKRIAEKSGIPASTLYAISSGDTDFDHTGISVLVKISDALGVTTDELYCALRYDEQAVSYAVVELPKDEPLESDERELVELYRQLDERRQERVLDGVRDYVVATKSGK